MGQRMLPVVLMIVFDIILGPILLSTKFQFPHLINLQRSLVVDLALAHLEPRGRQVVWTVLGAWRMTTRDA